MVVQVLCDLYFGHIVVLGCTYVIVLVVCIPIAVYSPPFVRYDVMRVYGPVRWVVW